jgi:hypothetical protein
MPINGSTEARKLRSRLSHPIIDADGHWLEYGPVMREEFQKANPMGARLNAIFSSDIGHFDVPEMTDVVPEAYELVEHELIDQHDFRDFMFANAVRFWGEVNPGFFKGTVVEKAAAQVLARPAAAVAAG